MGVDYEKICGRILYAYREFRRQVRNGAGMRKRKAMAYCAALLVQVKNGSRVSEAIEALRKFCKRKDRVVNVRVRKRKGDVEFRAMILPKEIAIEDLNIIGEFVDNMTRYRIYQFAKYHFGINTHSLRYAFITWAAIKRGLASQIIAKITGHKNLSHLVHYTQKVKAEEVLKELLL